MTKLEKIFKEIQRIGDDATMKDKNCICEMALELNEDELAMLPQYLQTTIKKLKELVEENKTTKQKCKANEDSEQKADVNISIVKMDKDKIKDKVSRGVEYGLIMFTHYNQLIAGRTLVIINEDKTGGMIIGKNNLYAKNIMEKCNPQLTFDTIKVDKIKDLDLEIWSIAINKSNNKNKFVL